MSSSKNRSDSGAPQPVMSPPSAITSLFIAPRLSTEEDYAAPNPNETGLHNRTQDVPAVAAKKQQHTRTKSTFSFAHPPRSTRRKRLALRSKLLLQLHRVSQTTRPIPAIDVLSSPICCGPRKLQSIYRGKDSAPAGDLILVTRDAHEPAGTEDDRSISSDDDPQDHGELVATVCHHRKEGAKSNGIAEISLQQGTRWEVSRLPSGGYEFKGTMENGEEKCARWVLRGKAGGRRVSGSSTGADNTFDDYKRFTFIVSGVWVAFREGWSQAPLFPDIPPSTPTTLGPGIRISSTSQQQQQQEQEQEHPESTRNSGNIVEREATTDGSARSKSFPFTGGRLRLGGLTLNRAKTTNKKSKNPTSSRRATSRKGKTRLKDDGRDQPSHDAHDSFQPTSLTIGEQTQTKPNPMSSDHGQYLSGARNLPSPRYSYGEDSPNDAISSAPSVYTGEGKPEQPKGKGWRRLGHFLDFVGKKGPAST
ncbi:predicted protein [Histoplasma mississippiense (nom. inval.)]|uniref:predicted protein n=1 Tax=Ajellomyces capsulatus (strain NAm1 / WU24) TaxID=2059318 RepID=UPI000157B84C|nr:predicted protein [Histoplasma mississippiense (nom. inval.)]EDN03722.1 predicted protein [Histoplasma mississippiense (nom. inval.)]